MGGPRGPPTVAVLRDIEWYSIQSSKSASHLPFPPNSPFAAHIPPNLRRVRFSERKAAERRKKVAHGASRGKKTKTIQPRRGERNRTIPTCCCPYSPMVSSQAALCKTRNNSRSGNSATNTCPSSDGSWCSGRQNENGIEAIPSLMNRCAE